MLHSVYDPIGFVAPLLLQGKIVLRDITESGAGWDSSLDPSYIQRWQSWTDSVHALDGVCIPRMYFAYSLTDAKDVELHVFSDASEQAIAAVAYLRCQRDTEVDVSFVFAKVKLAPTHGHTIPRLELCAALLATEVAKTVQESLRIRFRNIRFYSDSKVVLGYINNKTRRFYNYVSNRVDRILRRSSSDQWSYVTSKENPADHGTRGLQTVQQLEDDWLTGPAFLRSCLTQDEEDHPLVNPDDDKEIRVEVNKLVVSEGLAVFRDITERISSWESLISFVATMKKAVRRRNSCKDVDGRTLKQDAELFLLKLTQRMSFADELRALKSGESIGKDSPVASLSPYLDADDLLRVGGRLRNSVLPRDICNPVILLANSHITRLITINIHEKTSHQGRHLTEGAIRNQGYWIVGAKRLVSSVIHRCVMCRKLRGRLESQKMADLPRDRVTPGPPFTSVGVDTFGPWEVVARKTRGGLACSKRWAIMFTCLTTRAIHIEVIESMTSSSFINAVRRLIALRGNVTEFRSDMGTDFVGATEALKADVQNGKSLRITSRSPVSFGSLMRLTPHTWEVCGSA